MSKEFREAKFKPNEEREKASRFHEKTYPPTLTSQAMANELDINKIMDRLKKGQPVLTNTGQPWYGDVSEFSGLQDAIKKIQDAEELFMQMDAKIRERFENDPVKLMSFLEDPINLEEARELGIVEKAPVPEPGPIIEAVKPPTQLPS